MLDKLNCNSHEKALTIFKELAQTTQQAVINVCLQEMLYCEKFNHIDFIDYTFNCHGPTFLNQGDCTGKTLLVRCSTQIDPYNRSFYQGKPTNDRDKYIAIIERLIDLGADVNACYKYKGQNTNLLDQALGYNDSPMIRKLISSGAKALAIFDNKTESSNAQKALDEAFIPLIKRFQLVPLMGSGVPLLTDLIGVITGLLIKSCCSAKFNFPENLADK